MALTARFDDRVGAFSRAMLGTLGEFVDHTMRILTELATRANATYALEQASDGMPSENLTRAKATLRVLMIRQCDSWFALIRMARLMEHCARGSDAQSNVAISAEVAELDGMMYSVWSSFRYNWRHIPPGFVKRVDDGDRMPVDPGHMLTSDGITNVRDMHARFVKMAPGLGAHPDSD
jgi:hypothetical protein